MVVSISRNSVVELILTDISQNYNVRSQVFSCLELKKLRLDSFFLKPPLEFEGFLYLENLDLRVIDFGDSLCGTKINLPQLKVLSLDQCTNVYNFNIKAAKLQSLTVLACLDAMLLRLLDSPLRFVTWITFVNSTKDFLLVEKMNLTRMLRELPRVEFFCIDSHSLKLLAAEKIPKLLPCEISSLKHLELPYFELGDLDQLHAALCLLRNSPNLERLILTSLEMEPQVDVGPASNHLESPNCLDCTLNRLQTVEIESLQGSEPELLFIKLILAHSPSLVKFTITPSRASDVQTTLENSKDVMQFPRASPKAEVIY